jgi:hypothetical protein
MYIEHLHSPPHTMSSASLFRRMWGGGEGGRGAPASISVLGGRGAAVSQLRPHTVPQKPKEAQISVDSAQIFEKCHYRHCTESAGNSITRSI